MDNIKTMLAAWGAWADDLGNGGGCSSPSQALINCAPFADAEQKRVARYDNAPHISDEDALMVDAAIGNLKRHSERLNAILGYACDNDDMSVISNAMLFQVIWLRYREDVKSRGIAQTLNLYFEKRLFNQVSVDKMLERAHGFIERDLIDLKIK